MYKFLNIKNKEVFDRVKYHFKQSIEILYGSQDSALQKIYQAKDREGFILSYRNEDVGILVYKTKLIHEYGFKDSFEIKTLFVINPDKNSGKKFATRLILKATIKALALRAKSIFVTASSKRPNVIHFFQSKGFRIKLCMSNSHSNESDEYLLVHDSPIQLFLSLIFKLYFSPKKRLNITGKKPTNIYANNPFK